MARRRSESEAVGGTAVTGGDAATVKKMSEGKVGKVGKAGKGKGTGGGYKPRRDWSKIVFYTISVLVVLSMVLGLFASVLPNLGL